MYIKTNTEGQGLKERVRRYRDSAEGEQYLLQVCAILVAASGLRPDALGTRKLLLHF